MPTRAEERGPGESEPRTPDTGASDQFSDAFFTSKDGLRLHARVYSVPNSKRLPVVCLPGLTRNARDFHALAIHLSQKAAIRRKVIAFDYRGRGRSSYDRNWRNYDVAVEAGDIVAGLIAAGIERGHFIGTSRGGLIIHMLGAKRPALLKTIVLNDIGPAVEGEGLAKIRSYLTQGLKPKTMTEAVALQRATHGPAFPALTEADWERFTAAIYREQSGRSPP